jgi:hypothetical protein
MMAQVIFARCRRRGQTLLRPIPSSRWRAGRAMWRMQELLELVDLIKAIRS